MPLRRDNTLWANLSGCVTAYQPIGARDPFMARYNQRNGGTNAFRAEPGVLPAWSPVRGWTTTSANPGTHLITGVVPGAGWTVIYAFGKYRLGVNAYLGGVLTDANAYNYLYSAGATCRWFYGSGVLLNIPLDIANGGVLGAAGPSVYLNGAPAGTASGAYTGTNTGSIYIGNANPVSWNVGATFKAFAVYNRTFSPAEMWTASRQMAYCDVNPDWNVWARRRQWYIPSTVAGGQAFNPVRCSVGIIGSGVVRTS